MLKRIERIGRSIQLAVTPEPEIISLISDLGVVNPPDAVKLSVSFGSISQAKYELRCLNPLSYPSHLSRQASLISLLKQNIQAMSADVELLTAVFAGCTTGEEGSQALRVYLAECDAAYKNIYHDLLVGTQESMFTFIDRSHLREYLLSQKFQAFGRGFQALDEGTLSAITVRDSASFNIGNLVNGYKNHARTGNYRPVDGY